MTEIYLFGLKIMEPVTALTDFITALVCIISFIKLKKSFAKTHKYIRIIYYFLFTGLATFFAGLFSHALIHIVSFEYKMIGWTCSALGILAIEWILANLIKQQFSYTGGQRLGWIALIQFILFILAILYKPSRTFETVQINATLGLVGFVFPMIFYIYKKTRIVGLKYFLFAFIWAIITGLVFNLELSLHTYLNHHDISHLMMAFFIILMYLGTRALLKYDFKKNQL